MEWLRATYSHWLGKRRDMDQYICYSRRLSIDHILSFVHILVCIQYMDHQSIAANKHTSQYRYVPCKRHSLRMVTVRMDSMAYLELLAALKMQFNNCSIYFQIQRDKCSSVIWWDKNMGNI